MSQFGRFLVKTEREHGFFSLKKAIGIRPPRLAQLEFVGRGEKLERREGPGSLRSGEASFGLFSKKRILVKPRLMWMAPREKSSRGII